MAKCSWSHCKIEDNTELVKVSGRKYHKCCNDERLCINECISTFTEHINNQIVMSQLRSIINNLVFKQNFEARYVLYAINYAIEHPEYKLTYPQGLHRICKEKKILDSWQNVKARESIKDNIIKIEDYRDDGIKYNVTKKKRFVSDLLEV